MNCIGWLLILGVIFSLYGVIVGIIWWGSDLELNNGFGYSGIVISGLGVLIGAGIYIYEKRRGGEVTYK